MECSIQRGDSRVEWNIPSFTDVHYLFYIIPKYRLIDSYEKHFAGCDLSKTQRMQWNKTYSTIALAKSAMERIPLHS
jgi:hypothetical protein